VISIERLVFNLYIHVFQNGATKNNLQQCYALPCYTVIVLLRIITIAIPHFALRASRGKNVIKLNNKQY